MKIFTSAAVIALFSIAACGSAFADDCSGRDHSTGTVLGAVGGAAIGGVASHNVGGAVVGGVLGGLAGNAIARSEDCNRQQVQQQDNGRRNDNGQYQPRDSQAGYAGVYQQDYRSGDSESDYWGVESYDDFGADYRHIAENIQRGRQNGFYTSSQARNYYQQLQQIRSRADRDQRNGRFDPQNIEYRLARLRNSMHVAAGYRQPNNAGYQR